MTDSLAQERQLVVFELSEEAYALDIGVVREVIRMQEITHVPRTPVFLEGVINLRGRIIPVVDLRKKLGLPPGQGGRDTRIVVVDIGGQGLGLVVDAVTEVLRVPVEAVESPSALVASAATEYLNGIVNLERRLILLLDLERLLGEEVGEVQTAGGPSRNPEEVRP